MRSHGEMASMGRFPRHSEAPGSGELPGADQEVDLARPPLARHQGYDTRGSGRPVRVHVEIATEDHMPKPRQTAVKSNYEKIPQRVLQPPPGAMSARTLGVLCHLLSQPADWGTSAERLALTFTEGREAMETALNELERLGYLARRRVPIGRGRWSWVWIYGDDPALVAEDLAKLLAEHGIQEAG